MYAAYQPIVALADRTVVGYEALARDERDAFPAARFAAARADGSLAELDAACQRAAFAGASAIGPPSTLFINVEPECYDGPSADGADGPVIVELTERGLTARPAELLLAVERVRARGWGVAVDDIGVDWRSLALLPFLRPDVVKLDRALVADVPTPTQARLVRGVRAHLERHGGLLLAEGIETAAHEVRARGLGATLGQGWRYGRPGPITAPEVAGPAVRIVQPRAPIREETPFQVLRDCGRPCATIRKADLLPFSMDLEREARNTRDPAVVLATFQHAERFSARTRERYAELARGAAFVGVFGVGLSPTPAPGVRGANLESAEALRDEWSVLVVGPHSALGLIARDLGDSGRDADRRFEYALTEDRDIVMRAARALMLRVAAAPAARPAFTVTTAA